MLEVLGILGFWALYQMSKNTDDLWEQAERHHAERAKPNPIAKREIPPDYVPSPKAKPIPCDTRNIPAWPIR